MKKFRKFLILSFSALLILNNIYLFSLSTKYSIDNIVTPTIILNKNKYGNSEGITFNPFLVFNKKLKTKLQEDFLRYYLFINLGIALLLFTKRKELDYYGTAKFASKEEVENMGITQNTDDGVVLGMTENNKLITDNGVEHILNMAPTRTGKGINTVLTTLWTWKSSIIVNDIKGECWDLTSGFRRSVLKQKCVFFNPVDETGEGINYNPLELVRVGTRSEQEDARTIALTLLSTEQGKESDHWISAAINLLTAVILHVKYVNINASFIDVMEFLEDPKEPLTDKIGNIIAKELNEYGDVVDKKEKDEEGNVIRTFKPFNHFKSLNEQKKDNLTFFELYMKDTTLHPLVGSTFATLYATPDKERGSIYSTCITQLAIFKDPRVMKNIQSSDITPKDIMNNRISLYLITPPKAIKMTKPLFRLIICQSIFELTDKMNFNNRKKIDIEKKKKLIDFSKIKKNINKYLYKENINYSKIKNKKILFLLDEFPALGNLSIFEEAIAYIAGYGLKTLLIVQSINQLNKIYGKDNSIVDNCRVQLYFTPNDKETPKMISDMMGNKTERIITRSGKGFFMDNRSESYQARPLMTPGEIRVLPYEKILLLFSGKNPIKGNKIFWFKHKKFKNNADYNIPYKSYLSFVDKLEEEGVSEYAAEYLIYLTDSYKVLKSLIDKFGEEKFIKKILINEDLTKKIQKVLELSDKKLLAFKEKVLKNYIKKENYKTKEEYLNDFQNYLSELSYEELEKYIKINFFKNKKNLEKTLTMNLNKLKTFLDDKEKTKLNIIEYLKKEKKLIDSWIPNIPDNFVDSILENKIDIQEIYNWIDNIIAKSENDGETPFFDFKKFEVLSKNEKAIENTENIAENTEEIEDI